MELCGNGNLRTWLKQRKILNPSESLLIFLQIARGLEHVHAHKLIHRDLKPANILFNGKMAKISDFGWSVAHQSGESYHTARAGKPFVNMDRPSTTTQLDLFYLNCFIWMLKKMLERP